MRIHSRSLEPTLCTGVFNALLAAVCTAVDKLTAVWTLELGCTAFSERGIT